MISDDRPGSTVEMQIVGYDGAVATPRYDRLATEEPLEIRMRAGSHTRTVAITMRTPGADFELAAGFLFGEGVLKSLDAVSGISYCVDRDVAEEQRYNIVNVDLRGSELPPLDALERHFTMTSACGVCGKANIDALRDRGLVPVRSTLQVDAATVAALPDRLGKAQRVFASTGGLHAAALFDARGELVAIREDVGRHNALDKLVGWAFMEAKLPLDDHLALFSGRASYELLQKAISAGIAVVCAVSAPSSLAVDLAREFNVTLAGFVRGGRFNVYAGAERISFPPP
ncbi:MAG TPA: formate dehydrogenase accessory sulfurtransferase FdhD [Candidatus Lustribacter sp.]|nr:formate dehydrogenase accessory sulfurtransferase FdhD [Candidatus Lustribacter sp.]